MQIDWFTFIAQVINFLILIALLQRFLFKPVMKAMEERDKKIADELEEARLKKVEAEQKERQLEQELEDLVADKDQLMQQAREEVGEKQKGWMDELRTEIKEVRSQWMEAVETEKESFLRHLTEETGNRVVQILDKVLADLSEKNLQQQTVDFFFEKLQQLDEKEMEDLAKSIRDFQTPRSEVLSTFELSKKQKEQLMVIVNEKTGRELNYEFKISPELGFGLEIHVAGWRLGWNLKSYLQDLREDMNNHFRNNVPLPKNTNV